MPTCFTCKMVLQSVKLLEFHISSVHQSFINRYQCAESHCHRTFDSWKSFSAHLLRHDLLNKNTDSPLVSVVGYADSVSEPRCDRPQTSIINNASETEIDGESQFLPADCAEDNPRRVLHKIRSDIEKQANLLVAHYYAKHEYPRKLVQEIVDSITKFNESDGVNILRELIYKQLEALGAQQTILDEITTGFDIFQNAFAEQATEYRRLKKFKINGTLILPESVAIGQKLKKVKRKGDRISEMTDETIQLVSLRKRLKLELENFDTLDVIMNYQDSVEGSENLENFVQCELFKEKKKKKYEYLKSVSQYHVSSDIILPLFIYYDDFQVNAALGPHPGKIGGLYASIPCLPPECQGSLDNIYLVQLIKTSLKKVYNNDEVFTAVKDELKFLEDEGIIVSTKAGREVRIRFILGDNLGIHSMLDFVECFSATYPCRFCKATNAMVKQLCVEDPALLRTINNYQSDVELDNLSQTGIKKPSLFNDIQSFHVTENYCVDIMHDLLEGICHYDLYHILRHFIYIEEIFTLETFNLKLVDYDWGPIDSRNKPPELKKSDLSGGGKLKTTSADMWCLMRNLPIILGELIPVNDDFWLLFLLLRRIMDIVFAKKLPKNFSETLQTLVKEHNQLYLDITGDTLKPKMHNMIHYHSIMKYAGNLSQMSSMRFEGYHRLLKKSANAISSRINIELSLATKQQLWLNEKLIVNASILPKTTFGPQSKFFLDYVLHSHGISENVTNVSWVDYKGTKYHSGIMVVVGIDDDSCPIFWRIEEIFVDYDQIPIFVCSSWINVRFSVGYHAFELIEGSNEHRCIRVNELYTPMPLYLHTMSNGERYITLKFLI